MKPYVVHYCKNKSCNHAWMAKDDNRAQTYPPQSKFCPDCEDFGFINQKDPAKVAKGKALAEKMRQEREALAGL